MAGKILFTGLDDSMLGSPEMPDDVKVFDSDYKNSADA